MALPKIATPEKKEVSGTTYWIKPFPALKSANLSASLLKIASPFFGDFMDSANLSNIKSTDIKILTDGLSKCLALTDGDEVENLIDELLIKNNNIIVEWEGEKQPLTETLLNEIMAGNGQRIYLLAWEVIKLNYSGFFDMFSIPSGNGQGKPLPTKTTQS